MKIVNKLLDRQADKNYVDNNQSSIVSFNDLTNTHWAYYEIMEAANAHDYSNSNSVELWKKKRNSHQQHLARFN